MGIVADLPFAVAPGLEISTFFTYILVRGMHFTWRQALAAVFLSGILNLTLTFFSFRERIVEAIPDGLKASLLLAVGSFITLVGLKVGGVIDVDPHTTLVTPVLNSDFKGPIIMLVGTILCFAVSPNRFVLPFGIILSVVICTAMGIVLGFGASTQHEVGGSAFQTLFAFASGFTIPASRWLDFIAATLILFVIDFIGGVGKIVALTTRTSISTRGGRVPHLRQALFIDGAATVVGSLLGTSSLIAFVESRLGIESGARTGLAAIVCGVLMLSGLLYTRVFGLVPPIATAGILLYIGILLVQVNATLLSDRKSHTLDLIVGG
jgi:AGZA family xanthine/uracil permease-like MFS transporter